MFPDGGCLDDLRYLHGVHVLDPEPIDLQLSTLAKQGVCLWQLPEFAASIKAASATPQSGWDQPPTPPPHVAGVN